MMDAFFEHVYTAVRRIPRGKSLLMGKLLAICMRPGMREWLAGRCGNRRLMSRRTVS